MRSIRLVALFLVAFGFAGAAVSQTDDFTVTAEVIDACSMTAGDLDFGNYTSISGSNVDATSTVDVTCTNGTAYTVVLNAGSTSGGSLSARLMTDTTNTLQYNLYTTSARTTIWGDGSGGTDSVTGTGTGLLQSLTVYGRVPASQNVPVGSYSDLVTAEISF